ncbi:MAG: hypothetical protein JWR69_1512 [Pedosphaera sp.]|nr:hypothetical protein [Pedosphaera sp.]
MADGLFTLGATASSGLAVSYASSDTNVATLSGNTLTIVSAGATTITASQARDGATYGSATSVTQTLTVNPAALSITAHDASRCAGDTLVLAGTEFASGGLQNGETIRSVTLASNCAAIGAAAGSYDIIPSAAIGGSLNLTNYITTYHNGTLTVNSASASNVTYNEIKGQPFTLLESNLLTNASGTGGVTLTNLAPISANGITLTRSNGVIYYQGALVNNDSFTYGVISLAAGCTATGTVTINGVLPVGPAQISGASNGVFAIAFFGAPNST